VSSERLLAGIHRLRVAGEEAKGGFVIVDQEAPGTHG
jgi:hypothetical protein